MAIKSGSRGPTGRGPRAGELVWKDQLPPAKQVILGPVNKIIKDKQTDLVNRHVGAADFMRISDRDIKSMDSYEDFLDKYGWTSAERKISIAAEKAANERKQAVKVVTPPVQVTRPPVIRPPVIARPPVTLSPIPYC